MTSSRPIAAIDWWTLDSGGRVERAMTRVVEADDRDVLGDSLAGRVQRRQRPGGHQVRGREHRIDVRAPLEEDLHRALATLAGEPTALLKVGVERPARGRSASR